MNEIRLNVDDKNLEIVMGILNNLKSGLIDSIETKKTSKRNHTQYKPKSSGVVYEHESGPNDANGKYSVSAYKERLKKK